tara:strand:- start:169 stop:573 length:405 start_codon:yes stop_codon:yes gene_type:complete
MDKKQWKTLVLKLDLPPDLIWQNQNKISFTGWKHLMLQKNYSFYWFNKFLDYNDNPAELIYLLLCNNHFIFINYNQLIKYVNFYFNVKCFYVLVRKYYNLLPKYFYQQNWHRFDDQTKEFINKHTITINVPHPK